MLQSTFEETRAHLQIVLGIDLQNHLDFQRAWQFKTYALIGALIIAYRYAEALGEQMVVFDMTTSAGGHVPHKYGTDLDFDRAPGPEPADPGRARRHGRRPGSVTRMRPRVRGSIGLE